MLVCGIEGRRYASDSIDYTAEKLKKTTSNEQAVATPEQAHVVGRAAGEVACRRSTIMPKELADYLSAPKGIIDDTT